MVLKNLEKIKKLIPETLYTIMFYDDGTVFHANFNKEINLPKLGQNLSNIIKEFLEIYKLCDFPVKKYTKLIFETETYSIIVLRLGESSNAALILKKEEIKEFDLKPIRKYIEKIEDLVDMHEYELLIQDLDPKLSKLQELQNEIQLKNKKIEEIRSIINSQQNLSDEEKKKYEIEIQTLSNKITPLQDEINKLIPEIINLQNEINKRKKNG